MPVNKNASFRYRVIDKCLSNSARSWALEDLIDEIAFELEEQFGIEKGVGKRTVQDDISIMRSDPPRGFGAPIACKDGFYFYSDPEFSIEKSPLNSEDISTLTDAIRLINQFKGLPHFENMRNTLQKFVDSNQEAAFENEDIVQFESRSQSTGIEFLDPLYNHIKQEEAINVIYKPFHREENQTHPIHPYLLKEYNKRWFLLGLHDYYKTISIYALDRIVKLERAHFTFIQNRQLDPRTYLQNVIGVTIPEDVTVQDVKLHFSPKRLPYVVTKPLHESQKLLSQDGDGGTIQIKVVPNLELEQLLLSFGEDVTVLHPISLRNRINSRLGSACENYSQVDTKRKNTNG